MKLNYYYLFMMIHPSTFIFFLLVIPGRTSVMVGEIWQENICVHEILSSKPL